MKQILLLILALIQKSVQESPHPESVRLLDGINSSLDKMLVYKRINGKAGLMENRITKMR